MAKAQTAPVEEFTEEDLAGLSDEERAALAYEQEDAGDGGNEANDEGVSGDDDTTDDAAASATDDAAAGAQGTDPVPAAASADAASAATVGDVSQPPDGEGEEGEQGAESQQSGLTAIDDQYQTAVAELDAQILALGQQVEDGDLKFVDYHVKNLELQNAKIDLMRERDDNVQWHRAQTSFFAKPENALFADPMRQTFLQATLDRMAASGELSGIDYGTAITRAADLVKQAMGIAHQGAAPASPAKPKAAAKPAPQIPQTLGDVPAADENAIHPNRFAHLDKLEGDDLEAALAKMSTVEVEAWLENAGG